MHWILASLICSSSVSQEVKEFVEETDKQLHDEALRFLKRLHEEASSDPRDCAKCSQQFAVPDHKLMVFISFSVPLESWKEWSHALEKFGGIFVLKGIPENSFQVFLKKVIELRMAGVNAPIYIDPESYEKFKIEAVPAVVALDGMKYDKVAGNTHLDATLKLFNEKGVTVTPFPEDL